MKFSEEQIQDIIAMKEKMTRDIETRLEEINLLEKNIRILDILLKDSSFTKASSLVQKKEVKEEKPAIPITKGTGGEVIANAYVTPDQVSIVVNNDVVLEETIPPFRTFFLDRIIGDMKKKDIAEAEQGKIQRESVIDYVINKNGPFIREIVIRNYREKQRANELINTLSWSFVRMLENTKK